MFALSERSNLSQHTGNDHIPGERTRIDIFNAIQSSPWWEKTLLVIIVDEHGGIADITPNLIRAEWAKLTDEITSRAKRQAFLHQQLDDLYKKHNR